MNKLFSDSTFYNIAKILSNEFIGTEKTFTSTRLNGYNLLNSNVCDSAPLIRVYHNFTEISKVEVNGDYTDGWQLVMPTTMDKIITYFYQ